MPQYVLTGVERTIELECEVTTDYYASDNGLGAQSFFNANGYAKCGNRLTGAVEAPLLRVSTNGDTSAINTFLGGGAGLTASGLIPAPPYTISGTGRAWAKLSLVLEQYQTTDTGFVGERVKPGAHHVLEYEMEVWDGTTSTGTTTLTQGSTVRIIDFIDQCQQANAVVAPATNFSGTILSVATGPWDAEFRPYNQTVTQSSGSQSCTITADVLVGGIAQVDITGDYLGTCTVTGHPILKYQATIDAHFWRTLYPNQYKIRAVGQNVLNGAAPSNVALTGSGAVSVLHGPYSGSSGYNDDTHGGYSHIQIGFSQYFIGNRAGSFTLSMVSATTTVAGSPITHEDHPDGTLVAVRTDQSAGLSISHTGARVIEDGTTITPTDQEWIVDTGPGSITAGTLGGIRLQSGSGETWFQRGWVVYGPAPTYSVISGTAVECSAHRFVDIAYDAAAETTLTFWLPGPPTKTSIYGIEGVDPAAVCGAKRWTATLPAGAGTYTIDLCNPDAWPIELPRVDPPYDIISGTPPFSSPEGYDVLDMDQLRGAYAGSTVPTSVNNEGNFGGISRFSRLQIQMAAGGDVTINSITLAAPEEMCLDMGRYNLRLWVDGRLAAHRYIGSFATSATVDSFAAVQAYIDAIPGLNATTSITTAGSEPAEWSSRATYEDWNGRGTRLFYYGDVTNTNLGIIGASSVSAVIPLQGGMALPGNRAVAIAGYGPENLLPLRARFGCAFSGLCLKEPYLVGTGSVSVIGVGAETIGDNGLWGFPGTVPCRTNTPWRALKWNDALLEQLPLRPGGLNSADPLLTPEDGLRRITSWKRTPEIIPKAWVKVDTNPAGLTMFASTEGGTLLTGYSTNWATFEWQEKETTIAAEQPDIAFLRGNASGRVSVLYIDSGVAYWRYSDNFGGTWSVASTIWNSGATRGAIDSHPAGYQIAIARLSGAIEAKWLDLSGTVIAGPYTAVASGVADDAIDITWDGPAQRWYIMYLNSVGELQRVESSDGVTWS